jgi:hypothetical protein
MSRPPTPQSHQTLIACRQAQFKHANSDADP